MNSKQLNFSRSHGHNSVNLELAKSQGQLSVESRLLTRHVLVHLPGIALTLNG